MKNFEIYFTILMVYLYKFFNYLISFFIFETSERNIIIFDSLKNKTIVKKITEDISFNEIIKNYSKENTSLLIEYGNELKYLGVFTSKNISEDYDLLKLPSINNLDTKITNINNILNDYDNYTILEEEFENMNVYSYNTKDSFLYPIIFPEWIKYINEKEKIKMNYITVLDEDYNKNIIYI